MFDFEREDTGESRLKAYQKKIADHMDVFFTKLNEAEQKLPNKGLEDKYSSALDSLSTL